MRVFLGLTPDQSLIDAIASWRKEHQDLPVRWLNDEDLHITLIPPWNEENIPYSQNLLSNVEAIPKFTFNFQTAELGPSSEKQNPLRPDERIYTSKRLIWAVGETPPELLQFKYNLEGIFEKPHDPRFLLHITIARLNPTTPVSLPPEHVHWTGGAKSLALFKSLEHSKYLKLAEK